MSINTLYVLRGISGSGKTTLAKTLELTLSNDARAISADDFWYTIGKGEYAFDVKRLGEAHDWCRNQVKGMMENSFDNIIVHNTNTSEKELKPYLDLAEKYEYNVVSLIVEKRHTNDNVHGVPDYVLTNQEKRLKDNIKLS